MNPKLYLGIDVGTGSARAGLFDNTGRLYGQASRKIQMWKPAPDHVEQSSDDIWAACCAATHEALAKAKAQPVQIAGIGFDATCSLVALDAADKPVSVSTTGDDAQNVVVWMDHRAMAEVDRINATQHEVLRYVGGIISPEMQTPKLLWLKTHLPETWQRTTRFLDLPDYLTYRATGDDTRSLCTTVCKWTYQGQLGTAGEGWSTDYFEQIGLADLAADNWQRIGNRIRPMGEPIGQGLTAAAAADLGLLAGTPVGVGIIDAHAGGLGLLGSPDSDSGAAPSSEALGRRLALIGGTSTCHMAVSEEPRYIDGIWGPYYSAMIPGLWLTEGGQSATGALIDHIIFSHAAYPALAEEATAKSCSIYELLNDRIEKLTTAESLAFPAELTQDLHVQPDFHGNRSPRADPSLRGMISGLTLSATADDLARLYLATIQSVAHGTKHILTEMSKQGYEIDSLYACGGGTKNPVFLREHADITGCRIVLPKEPEAVLLGSAVLGATASGDYSSIPDAMSAMNANASIIEPSSDPAITRYHAIKHQIFHRLHSDQQDYRSMFQV